MWKRTVGEKALRFHLAGINNQNFIMRDEETGSFWQQVTGLAISGPMKGTRLELVSLEELSFGEWKEENPAGQVLAPDPKFEPEYAPKDWEADIAKMKTPNLSTGNIPPRELMVGISLNGADRAYPWARIQKEAPIMDSVGGVPIAIVLGPDKKSLRVFRAELPTTQQKTELFRATEAQDWALFDSATSSRWDFSGCSTEGPEAGRCLTHVDYLKDYWFDWRNYHPNSTAYLH